MYENVRKEENVEEYMKEEKMERDLYRIFLE